MSHPLQVARQELLAFALTLPGTREDHPWGESVAKVGDKVFVFFGRSSSQEPRFQFAVKLPRSGLAALDLGFTEPTGYGMGKHGWVTATFQEGDRPDLARARAWVLESYRAIAPKRLLAALQGVPGSIEGAAAKSPPEPWGAPKRKTRAPAKPARRSAKRNSKRAKSKTVGARPQSSAAKSRSSPVRSATKRKSRAR